MPPTRAAVLALALATAPLLTGCSSAAAPDLTYLGPAPKTVTVGTMQIAGLGQVLASDGKPLYVFSPDHQAAITCTRVCAGTWPPLRIATGTNATSSTPAVSETNLSSTSSPDGYLVVSFHGWPLYFYAGDVADQHARGQALFANGGPWYLMSPDGSILTTKLATS